VRERKNSRRRSQRNSGGQIPIKSWKDFQSYSEWGEETLEYFEQRSFLSLAVFVLFLFFLPHLVAGGFIVPWLRIPCSRHKDSKLLDQHGNPHKWLLIYQFRFPKDNFASNVNQINHHHCTLPQEILVTLLRIYWILIASLPIYIACMWDSQV